MSFSVRGLCTCATCYWTSTKTGPTDSPAAVNRLAEEDRKRFRRGLCLFEDRVPVPDRRYSTGVRYEQAGAVSS